MDRIVSQKGSFVNLVDGICDHLKMFYYGRSHLTKVKHYQ